MVKTEKKTAVNDITEGLIRLDEEGWPFIRRTGGCCRNKSEARGFFTHMPVFPYVKRLLREKIAPNETELDLINEYFEQIGWPFKAVGGEEAWLHLEGAEDSKYILTWQNSY